MCVMMMDGSRKNIKTISSLGGVGLIMSKGAVSASMGPFHLFVIIIIVRIMMKVLEILRNTIMKLKCIEIAI